MRRNTGQCRVGKRSGAHCARRHTDCVCSAEFCSATVDRNCVVQGWKKIVAHGEIHVHCAVQAEKKTAAQGERYMCTARL